MARLYDRGDQPVPGYRLAQFLGRGGIGEVWKASGPGGTECAIKIINLGDKQGLKEFRATRLVKRVRHPYLTPIIAFWLKDEQGTILEDAGDADSVRLKDEETEMIIAMGLGEKNLADRLRECREQGMSAIPTAELLNYMEEAAKAIDFLNQPRHDLGSGPVAIQHCDIKPQNILIVGGSAQVCDFGLARQLSDARKTSMAAGTYAYIAPESIESKPSKTNDQYSLAISYVELRTGSLPFFGTSIYDVMFAHLQGKLDFSKLPERERLILKRATERNPEERFATTLDMVKALRKVIEGRSSPTWPLPAAPAAAQPAPRSQESGLSAEGTKAGSSELPSSGHPRTGPAVKPAFDPYATSDAPLPIPPKPESRKDAPAGRPATPPPPSRPATPPPQIAQPKPRPRTLPDQSEEKPAAIPQPMWKTSRPANRKQPGFLARLLAWFFGP